MMQFLQISAPARVAIATVPADDMPALQAQKLDLCNISLVCVETRYPEMA